MADIKVLGGDAAHFQQVLEQCSMTEEEYRQVMRANENWSYDAAEDGWVQAHAAVRMETRLFVEAVSGIVARLEKGEAVAGWMVANLQKWWPVYEHHIHHHHDNEEKIVMPMAAKYFTMPDKVAADHVTLLKALDDISSMVKGLQAGRSAAEDLAVYTDLRAKASKMQSEMEEHLSEEEEIGLPMMRKSMTQKQFKPIEKKIVSTLTPADLGWVLHEMKTDAARRAWMTNIAGIPGFVQSLVMLPAHKKYANTMVRMMEEVKQGQQVPPKPKGCFGF